eukprot:220190_1
MAPISIITVNALIWIISNVILVPIESYYAYQIYVNSGSLVIAKRKPGILLISVISAILFYFFYQTILLILSVLGISALDPLSNILYYVILPMWYVSWFTFICRLWILYYTIRHTITVINNKWQSQISKSKNACDDYYLRFKSTLGTWTGLKKKILIYAFFTYLNDVVYGSLLLVTEDDATAFWAVIGTLGVVKALSSTIIPMVFLVYMTYQVNQIKYADNLGLGRELRYCTYGYLMILVIRCVDYTISWFSAREEDEFEQTVSFIVALEFFAWKLVGFGINLLQTRDPLNRFGALIKRYSTRQLGLLAHTKTLRDVDKENQASLNETLKMNEVLHTEHSFNLFMAHCGAEHCTECVLSMIEIVQFKDEMYKKLSGSGRGDEVTRELNEAFILPENCPQSDIVFDKEKNFKGIAIALFDKYIAVGSDWEINVDYYTRRKYNRLFGDADGWMKNEEYDDNVKLYEVFDKCLTEMVNLVRAAFSRFKKTESFLILQNKTPTMRGTSVPYDLEEVTV